MQVFSSQGELQAAFKAGKLDRDVVCVVRFQGPRANGMPELHKLTPPLGVLQNRGFKVALVTDGRMSGASGKVPCAIHVSPESLGGGPIGLTAALGLERGRARDRRTQFRRRHVRPDRRLAGRLCRIPDRLRAAGLGHVPRAALLREPRDARLHPVSLAHRQRRLVHVRRGDPRPDRRRGG